MYHLSIQFFCGEGEAFEVKVVMLPPTIGEKVPKLRPPPVSKGYENMWWCNTAAAQARPRVTTNKLIHSLQVQMHAGKNESVLLFVQNHIFTVYIDDFRSRNPDQTKPATKSTDQLRGCESLLLGLLIGMPVEAD